jgi:molybdopterin-biosynthesis enzyme MoeA-like protein
VVPRFGLYVIGDEILSGKRTDKHFPKVIELLNARGLRLSWAHYLPDDRAMIADALRRSFATDDVVFSCGGIGATPDDHTRHAAAEALGVELELHPEAAALIAQRCAEMAAEGRGSADMSTPENRQRLKMGEFPRGARIIENPFNRIPGFAVARHYFMPGFPVMAWPMIEWVLDTLYPELCGGAGEAERGMIVEGLNEGTLTPLLDAVEREFPAVHVYSLPRIDPARPFHYHIDLGVKGERGAVEPAFTRLRAGVLALGGVVSSEEAG